jgi:two-component system sensor histidine kinase/response regulator
MVTQSAPMDSTGDRCEGKIELAYPESMPRSLPSVLLVDDTEANLVALEALLAGLPCELVRARDGNEALKQLLIREFAVMLLDVRMPGMDGYEVARYARENSVTRDIPIIFLTATQYTEESVLRGYGSGAVDFLLKPFSAQVLRAKVRVFLELCNERRKLADEISAHGRTLRVLEETNTALRHFTNAASHDLRAPLRAIRGFLEALFEETGESLSEQARDYLNRSRRASQRMDGLLSSLLGYAGLQKAVTLTEIDCGTLMDQVRADLDESLETHGVTLEVGALPVITSDAARLYQLFVNLVGNAIKFRRTDDPPRIGVTAMAHGKHWIFCVSDNGIGIDPAHGRAVFDAFRRLHAESKFEGSGLGLTICQHIVEQLGGRIWMESELGRGSRFYFDLPIHLGRDGLHPKREVEPTGA